MILELMLTLGLSAAPSVASESPYLTKPQPAEFGVAPPMVDLVEGLPELVLGPDDLLCFPPPTHTAIAHLLHYAYDYPKKVCQPAIDTTMMACRIYSDQQTAELNRAHLQAVSHLKTRQGVRPWVAVAIAVTTTLLGALGGYLGGRYLR